MEAIPSGKVSTYGMIGRLAGFPTHPRLVGYALRALPSGSDVPWHRVINAGGRISLRTGSDSQRRQRTRLEEEGVVFTRGRVSLAEFGWPDHSYSE